MQLLILHAHIGDAEIQCLSSVGSSPVVGIHHQDTTSSSFAAPVKT